LCSPNNPTGAVYNYKQLTQWVNFAKKSGSVVIFDSAYSSFITGKFPKSIFEIDGAKDIAIEINSLSKSAGFTGLRCSFTIISNPVLKALWSRRQATKFNGVSYVIQKAAAAALSPMGIKQCRQQTAYYLQNARLLYKFFSLKKIKFYGGINSPYIWLKIPNKMCSWDFFDKLLHNTHIVGTPGCGFGVCGEGYFRLSAFALRKDINRAVMMLDKTL
jgi:LL-diaminopimelate aminotransferase